MVAENHLTIRHEGITFSYADACKTAERIAAAGVTDTLLFDLSRTSCTTTAALARLVLLRKELLESGGDLRVLGLQGQPLALCQVLRLSKLLCGQAPCPSRPAERSADQTPSRRPAEPCALMRPNDPARAFASPAAQHLTTCTIKGPQPCPA